MSGTPRLFFADIDGVLLLASDQSSGIGEEAKSALSLAREMGYEIILHSSWRMGLAREADLLFEQAGHSIDVVLPPEIPSRREAIVSYLYDRFGNDWPEDIIVVDDFPIAPIEGVKIIRIDPVVGLLRKHLIGKNEKD